MSKLKTVALGIAATGMLALAAPVSASAQLHVPYGNEALADFVNAEINTPTQVAGANNIFCRPSAAHPYPVVLVHGTVEDEGSNWVTLAPLLANNGYCVFAFNYGETGLSLGGRVDGLNFIERSAEELSSFVNAVLLLTGAAKVDLVGHSQGGMMPNYYLKFLGGAGKVNELVGLAPSNHGTTLDGFLTLLKELPFAAQLDGLLEVVGVPSLVQQGEGSTFMHKLFGSGEPLVPGVRYVVIESTHDEVVTPYTNAFLHGQGVSNVTIQEQCPTDPTEHIGMNWDSPSLQNVLNQLSQSPNPSFKATCSKFGSRI
jgi:triacylglycerol esterase/lipase EstA (alpha/beta hydrolase family)